MAEITLHYFDFHARGEAFKIIFHYYDIQFNNHLIAYEEWGKLKTEGFTEFGQLPRLDIDGKQLVQSYSALRYLAQKYGFYPTDPYEIYLVESIVALREDIYAELMPNFYNNKPEGVTAYYQDKLPGLLQKIEKRIHDNDPNGHFFVGSHVSLADFVLFQFGYDHFLRPNLKERFEGVLRDNAPTYYRFVLYFKDSNERVRNYLAQRVEKAF